MRTLLQNLPTNVQAELLDTLDELESLLGRMPTLKEISTRQGIAVSGVYQHMRALKRKGYLQWEPDKSRTLQNRGIVLLGTID